MSATDLDMRRGNWTLRNGRRREELQLPYLIPWSESPGHPQGAPVGGRGGELEESTELGEGG